MKTLYIECHMGAAGDMLLAALIELTGEPDKWVEKLNELGLPGVHVSYERSEKCGIRGTRVKVTVHGHDEHDHHHEHHHDHSDLPEIQTLINALNVSQRVKDDAAAVYQLIASAEAEAHGCEVELVHFHEVGAMDAVADIVGVCMLMEALGADTIAASPVHVGSGTVHCAHGILPVPAPATASILRGIPAYGGTVDGELCTPTGAALLRHFAKDFIPMPSMRVEKIGIGLGTKDFAPRANLLRVFLGESGVSGSNDSIAELCCNLDDMTGEEIGYAVRLLLEAGALDVFTVPVQMKKDRPGTLLTVLCRIPDAGRLAVLMLRHTSTFGVRKSICERYMLDRSFEERETPFGSVTVKTGVGYGAEKTKIEYDSAVKAAERHNVPLRDVFNGCK